MVELLALGGVFSACCRCCAKATENVVDDEIAKDKMDKKIKEYYEAQLAAIKS